MKWLYGMAIIVISVINSCTYSITQVHTQGEATDVVDNNQKADADVSPNLTIPASVIP